MIIDDVNDRTPLKSPQTVLPPDESSLEAGLGLPPSPPPYVSYQAVPVLPIAPRRKSRQRLGRRRFRPKHIIAVSIALNCLLVLLLIRILPRRADKDDSHRSKGEKQPTGISDPIQAVIPASDLGRCVRNATWSNVTPLSSEDKFQFSSDATFQFPDASSLLFLLSRGALYEGHLDVLPSSDPSPHVRLSVRYHSLHVRDRANVCLMERKHANGTGIGIFTPAPFDEQSYKDRLDFKITLFLPTQQTGSALPVYNLETQLPSFSHSLDSLRDVIEFESLILRSQNKPVSAKSLFARNATIETSNGLISGSFDASSSLSLVTSNAPIYATVKLHNQNVFATTDLLLQTRNAQLETAVSLVTSAASGQGGKFAVKAQTSDGPLVMSFPDSPTHSVLNLDARTSNSPANVWLNNAFEGDFTLASSMVLVDRRPFLDPRKLRSVLYTDFKNGMVVGNVRWKLPIFKSKVLGLVRVSTTNDILKLYV
ncbi:hypothetical protein C8R47DRAFT_1121503 [Mycena vitilis]|nr:hypothetical protein C8R47DRAFT_1121503 [Mycena vitilis]